MATTSNIWRRLGVFIHKQRLWSCRITVKVLLNIESLCSELFRGGIQDLYLWSLQLAVVRRKIRWIVFWGSKSALRLRRRTVFFNCWTHIFLLFSLTAFAFIFHSLLCRSSHYSWFWHLVIWFLSLINDFNWGIGRQVTLIYWFLRPWLHIYLSQLGLSTAQLCLSPYFDYF